MAIPVAIQPFYNATSGPLDLFTGVLYIMRVLTLGHHGSIQPSTEDSGVLEQNIFNPYPSDNLHLWYFEPDSSSPGLYFWKTLPNATVIWDASEEPGTSESYNDTSISDEDKSYPLLLSNLSDDEVSSEDNPLVSSLWTLQPHDLNEFGLTGTGYSMKSFNPLHSITGSVTLGSESTKGWWLQVDEKSSLSYDNRDTSNSCNNDKECMRGKSDTIILFEPTNFKLHADTNHMDIGEFSDILKRVRVRKEHLSNKVHLYNPSPTEHSFNVSLDTIVEYDVVTQPQEEFQMFSSLTIFNPMTNPSMKYFNFEEGLQGEDYYNGKDLRLKASSYIKSVEEIDAEPFTTKTVSGYVTYIEEFGGIPYSSWTNVSAQIDTLKRQEGTGSEDENKSPLRWVQDSALLKHLVRSRGYQGQMKEVKTGPGEPAKIAIKIRGTIRGRLPLPYIQFEEISTSPYHTPDDQPSSLTTNKPQQASEYTQPQSFGGKFTSHLS